MAGAYRIGARIVRGLDWRFIVLVEKALRPREPVSGRRSAERHDRRHQDHSLHLLVEAYRSLRYSSQLISEVAELTLAYRWAVRSRWVDTRDKYRASI